MASFNKVMLMGNLTRDPELKYTPSGQAVCEIGLAVNRRYSVNGQDREEVCYVDIVAWGRLAETSGKYLQKGSLAFFEGRLQYDSWEDKEGKKRSKLRVNAEKVQFLNTQRNDSRQSGNAENYGNNNYSQNNYQQPANQNTGQNRQYNNEQQPYSGGNTKQGFQQNQPVSHQVRQNEPMPPPPPEVFDNEEPEDDIPF